MNQTILKRLDAAITSTLIGHSEDPDCNVGASICILHRGEEVYLIVYDKGQETTELFTHMPLAEFPAKEQERLMAGIWFPTMAEIFSYLESYSS